MTTTTLANEQLPYLIRLLEDDTPAVRQAVLDALAAFGPELESELDALETPPTPDQWDLLRELMNAHLRGTLPKRAFVPGQVIRHKHYGYRGVIVEATACFAGDEEWYQRNQTQPDKNQPWYHVLVHNAGQVTYAAQTSLEADDSEEQVAHPYVPFFFSEFKDGRYVRNDQPWPDSE